MKNILISIPDDTLDALVTIVQALGGNVSTAVRHHTEAIPETRTRVRYNLKTFEQWRANRDVFTDLGSEWVGVNTLVFLVLLDLKDDEDVTYLQIQERIVEKDVLSVAPNIPGLRVAIRQLRLRLYDEKAPYTVITHKVGRQSTFSLKKNKTRPKTTDEEWFLKEQSFALQPH